VAMAGPEWESRTKASEDNYKLGVQAAMGRGAFGKGVAAAGAGKYTERATKLGSQRYGPGVQVSEGDWAKGVQPYAQALQGLELPPPGPRRSPQNRERSNKVAVVLGELKERM